jgi:ketosteroid isomerase-like protein
VSQENVQVVEKFITSLTSGDLDGALALVTDDLELVESGSIPHDGTYRGRDGVVELMTKVGQSFGGFELKDPSFHDAGEFVVGRMTATFRSKTSAEEVTMAVAEHYWVRDGKIAYVDVYYKDPAPLLTL